MKGLYLSQLSAYLQDNDFTSLHIYKPSHRTSQDINNVIYINVHKFSEY